MAKAGNRNHRDKRQECKDSGRKEENKRAKQERNEKQQEKARIKREEKAARDGEKKANKKPRRRKREVPLTPPYQHKLPIQKWASVMRKLDNYLEDKKKTDKPPVNTSNQYPKHHKHDDIDAEE